MLRTLVLAAATASCPALAASAPTAPAPPPKGVETGDLNQSVDPCTDFYEFANGTWRASNPIPPGRPAWSRRVAAREANQQRVRKLLEGLASRKDWPPGSVEQLLGDHYASCIDESGIDAAGLRPLASLLGEIDAASNPNDVQRVVRRLHELAIFVPFEAVGAMNYQAPTHFIVNVAAGGLGLPDRDDYLKADPQFLEARERYRAHVVRVFELGGLAGAQASAAAEGVLALETRLAEASLGSATAADPAATDHKLSFAQLEQLAPHFDWDVYFGEARLPRVELNVAEPQFMRQLDKELHETPVATWKAYLRWHVLESASPWLSQPFVEESFQFRDKYLGKAGEMKSRAERCAGSVEALFGDALGKKYVERYFPPAARVKAQEIARNLLAELTDAVSAVQWLEPQTKRTALGKVAAIDVQLGYPDTWKDYSAVRVRRDSFWANVAAGRRFVVRHDREQIGKPTRHDLWALAPSSPGAYIDLQLNELVLPAGFLQAPYFDVEASDAVNYGALGIGLAHDLTHAIDALGAETDLEGRPRNWWTEADRQEFARRGQCVVDQFEGYFVEPGVHHQGSRVRGEAIADLAGVRLAYRALRRSMKGRPAAVLDGFTPEQQFFISWGQTTGAAMSLEAQRELVGGDPHPVPRFRVIGPLSNSPEFQHAFSCKEGAAMVRPAAQRCAVW